MAQELKVIQDFYDFMLWLIRHTEKFPRHHRYSLGVAMENRLQRILELLLRAKYSRDKAHHLSEANVELEVLRFQLRLAKDLEALPYKSHGYASQTTHGLGSQIGGWLASRGEDR
jgi:23S rRNA-intervening sequence protein